MPKVHVYVTNLGGRYTAARRNGNTAALRRAVLPLVREFELSNKRQERRRRSLGVSEFETGCVSNSLIECAAGVIHTPAAIRHINFRYGRRNSVIRSLPTSELFYRGLCLLLPY